MIAKFTRYLRVAATKPVGFPSVLVLVPDLDRERWLRDHLASAAGNVEPDAVTLTALFFSSNLELIKALGPLGNVWRPILGSERTAITNLPAVGDRSSGWSDQSSPDGSDQRSHDKLLALCLGRRWCQGPSRA